MKMNTSRSQSKVYIEIVESIREMIQKDGLQPGDRLPSERELSESLGVGRSSVREALRSLELLGLIETRRGEGTFIRDFKDHRLVELLSTFILTDGKVQEDILQTLFSVEQACLLLMKRQATFHTDVFNELLHADKNENGEHLWRKLFSVLDNRLLTKIWSILYEYAHPLNRETNISVESFQYLIQALVNGTEEDVILQYRRIRNLSDA
jgi:GntR family transcriptional regulator, transcriptional repressor for pyruvate dehydrogenase complex